MDIEKLIEGLKTCARLGDSPIMDGFAVIADKRNLEDTATALSTLQAENEKLRAKVDNWKKKYVEANGKWIEAENKWHGLDKAVKNGNVYRPMQEELTLTHEENQSLKDANEKLRTELERMKEIMRDNGIMTIPPKYPGGPTEWNIQKPRNQKED